MDDLNASAVSMSQEIVDEVLNRFSSKSGEPAVQKLRQLWMDNLRQRGIAIASNNLPKKRRIGHIFPSERLQEVVPSFRSPLLVDGIPLETMKRPTYLYYPSEGLKSSTSRRKSAANDIVPKKVIASVNSNGADVVVGMSVQVRFSMFAHCTAGPLELYNMNSWYTGRIINVSRSNHGQRKIIGIRVRLHCSEFEGEFDVPWPSSEVMIEQPHDVQPINHEKDEIDSLLDAIADNTTVVQSSSSSSQPKKFDVMDLLLGDDLMDQEDFLADFTSTDVNDEAVATAAKKSISNVMHENSSLWYGLEPLDIPNSSSTVEINTDQSLLRLATGEGISSYQVNEANSYGLNWATKRPKLTLVPSQPVKSLGEIKNVPVDASVLSTSEDPTVMVDDHQLLVLGRLSQMSRQKINNRWHLTLFDAYVTPCSDEQPLSTETGGGQSSSVPAEKKNKDFIVPIVKITLDGQELFTEENKDFVYPTNSNSNRIRRRKEV